MKSQIISIMAISKNMVNNKFIKILKVTAILYLLAIPVASAQFIHEFSFDGGMGLSTLSYKPSLGARSGAFGGNFGVGYTFFSARERVTGTERIFRELWGVHTGLEIALYNANASLDNMKTVSKGLDDGEGLYSTFDLHTTLKSYLETQKTVYLNIPVMALFQREQIYAMGGVKLGFPISGKYSSKDATLTNEAFYEELDNWAKTQEFAGYGTFKSKQFEGNLEPEVAIILALEAGYKWRLADNISIYTGVYFDYGLNNIIKGNTKSLIKYSNNHPANFTTNSVLTTFSDKTNLMAVGIKLRFAMER